MQRRVTTRRYKRFIDEQLRITHGEFPSRPDRHVFPDQWVNDLIRKFKRDHLPDLLGYLDINLIMDW